MGSHTSMYLYVVLRGPTYRENSHANHPWNPQSHQTACFKGSETPPVWVRFPSPPPFRWLALAYVLLGGTIAWFCVSKVSMGPNAGHSVARPPTSEFQREGRVFVRQSLNYWGRRAKATALQYY
jgi:hypothetical protein